MNIENRTKNNKLLAEFMGWEFGRYEHLPNKGFQVIFNSTEEIAQHLDQMRYDCDWNYLMEVVEKIESLSNDKRVIDWSRQSKTIFDFKLTECKIQDVYDAGVIFVKWYNENSAKEN